MSSSEDKCQVSKDKHEDRGKMKYFCEAINSTEGRKGKNKLLGSKLVTTELMSESPRKIIPAIKTKKEVKKERKNYLTSKYP